MYVRTKGVARRRARLEPEDAEVDLLIAIINLAHRDAKRGPDDNAHYRSATAFLHAAGVTPVDDSIQLRRDDHPVPRATNRMHGTYGHD